MARDQSHKVLQASELERRAAAVLSGRERPSGEELVELIRQINPTGRELPEVVTQRRYLVKSQLQSLLLRRFGDDIEVLAEPDQVGVVRLRHRFVERGFAAHAVVAELDEDVRAAVQLRLDTADCETLPPKPLPKEERGALLIDERSDGDAPLQSLPWTELLARGRAALLEYDFEEARTCLYAAVSQSGGALLAALPLCELLVEQLMADAEALELATTLSAEATANPGMRTLLALAAARVSPDAEARATAERWLRGVADAQAVPVWIALTERALREGADEEAALCLTRVQTLDVPAPELLRLGEMLQARRRTKWRAAESTIENAFAAGDLGLALSEAQMLLAHWPESKVARRVMAIADERRREEESARLLAAGHLALEAGELERAIDCARSAAAQGADTAALLSAIETARLAARARHEQEQVQAVLRRLASPECGPGLLGYLQLSEHLRSEVRRASGLAILDWLDELGAAGTGARAQAAVEAVLALRAAEALRDPEAVLKTLAAHDKVLAKVARARALQGTAHAELLASRRRFAEECYAKAQDASNRGELETARQLLAAADPKTLDKESREHWQTLLGQLQRRATQQQRALEYERRAGAGDLLGAAAEADALALLGSPDECALWKERRGELRRSLAATWRHYEVCGTETPLSELPHAAAEIAQLSVTLRVWQALADDELTLGAAYADWLFLWNVDVNKQTLRRAIALRLPAPLLHPKIHRIRDELWVFDKRYLLVLDPAAQEIRAWQDLTEYAGFSTEIDLVEALPEMDCVWISLKGVRVRRVIVIDRRRGRRREIVTDPYLFPFPSGSEPLMATLGSFFIGGPLRLYDATGRSHSRPEFPEGVVLSATIHPDGQRIFGAVAVFPAGEREILFGEAGRPEVRHPLPAAHQILPPALCASRSEGLVLVSYPTPNERTVLRAYRPSQTGMELLWESETPQGVTLVQDFSANQVVALFPADRGCLLCQIGVAPPPEVTHIPIRQALPPIHYRLDCEGPKNELPDWVSDHIAKRGPRLTEQQKAEYKVYREKMHDPVWLLSINRTILFDEQEEHLNKIAQMAPDLPLLKVAWAAYHARRQNWDFVRTLLEQVDLEQIDESFRRHGLHLLGSLRLRSEDIDGARQAWERALACPGDCPVEACLSWLDAITLAKQASSAAEPGFLGTLAGAIRTADERLTKGDAEGARHALERTWIIVANEGQSLARLASAHLQLSSKNPLAQHSKAVALARFCSWHETAESEELFVPGAHWDKDRLKDIHSQAKGWLDEEFNVSASMPS